MLLGFNNYADESAASYTGGSWIAPLTNLQSPVVSERARSNGLSTSNTRFRVDLGVSRSLKFWAITHTNLTAAGLYRLTWYSDAFSTAVSNSGWDTPPGYPTEDPDGKGVSIFHVFDSALDYRYWEVEFDDQLNPDNYIEIGRNIMPEELGMSRNPDVGMGDDEEPNTLRQNALGGTGFFNRRKPVRKLSFGYNILPGEDAAKIRRLRKICNLNKQVTVIPDPTDTANLNDRCFVGTLGSMPKIELQAAGLASGSGFEIVEVV